MKKQRDIKVTVIYTPGWEDRVAKAAYELYKRIEAKKAKEVHYESFNDSSANDDFDGNCRSNWETTLTHS